MKTTKVTVDDPKVFKGGSCFYAGENYKIINKIESISGNTLTIRALNKFERFFFYLKECFKDIKLLLIGNYR